MISNIIFAGLILIAVCFIIAYNYIVLWRMPREEENREKLSLYGMLFVSTAVFCLFLAWRLKEPLAKDFLIVFFVLSLVVGFLARESAISPYQLAEFWKKPKAKAGKKTDETIKSEKQ